MALKSIFIILISLLIGSCKLNEGNKSSGSIPSNEWATFDELLGSWTKLERDRAGYFLYDPCDRETPSVAIYKDSIVLRHQIETSTTLNINKFEVSKKKISIHASTEGLESDFEFKIVEPNSNFILFKWNHIYGKHLNHGKEVITLQALEPEFRLVKDLCDVEKIPNQEFLPVIYE